MFSHERYAVEMFKYLCENRCILQQEGLFFQIKAMPVYLKIQMQANVTLQMYFKKAHPLMLISLLNCSAAVKS